MTDRDPSGYEPQRSPAGLFIACVLAGILVCALLVWIAP